jgi:hypothetical protein
MNPHLKYSRDNILQKIGTTNKFFVEFGTYDGLDDNASDLMLNEGWEGLFIEADDVQFDRIVSNCANYPVTVIKSFINAENINNLLEQGRVPQEFDFLSIDIDGMDYWVWKAMQYKPRAVFIEFNGVHIPPKLAVQPYDANNVWNHTRWFGASLQSLVNLGKELGYELVGCEDSGGTAFFVAKEEFPKMGIEDNSIEKLFVQANYGVEADGGHPYPDGPYLEI